MGFNDEAWYLFIGLLIAIGTILGVAGTSLILSLYWWIT